MKILELFSGYASFSRAAQKRNYQTYTVDILPEFKHRDIDLKPSLVTDILKLQVKDLPKSWRHPDVVWASIPCRTFSWAALAHHWAPNYQPRTEDCKIGIALAKHTLELIKELKPKYWIIENPVGMLGQMPFMPPHPVIVTYCQYKDDQELEFWELPNRMKRTHIWTNIDTWEPRPRCHEGDPCHVAAKRRSNTGTQGVKGKRHKARKAIIPHLLCDELLDAIEEGYNESS